MLVGSNRRSQSVAFSPDGARLLVGDDDGFVRRYDAATGRETGNFPVRDPRDPIHAVAFAPDGLTFAVAAPMSLPVRFDEFPKPRPSWDGVVSILDESGREVCHLPPMSGKVRAVAFSGDGKRIAAMDQTYVVRTWRMEDDKEISVSEAHMARGQSGYAFGGRTGFSSDLKRAVVINDCPDGDYGGSSWAQVIRLVEAEDREPRMIRQGGDPIGTVAISADGSRVATSLAGCPVAVWDYATGRRLNLNVADTPRVTLPKDWIAGFIAFSPDGRRIVAGSNRELWVHEDDGKEAVIPLRAVNNLIGSVRAVVLLRDRIRFASGGWNILEGEFDEVGGGQHARFEPIILWEVEIPEKK